MGENQEEIIFIDEGAVVKRPGKKYETN